MSKKPWMEIVRNQDLAKAYLKKHFIQRVRTRSESLNIILLSLTLVMALAVILKPDSVMAIMGVYGLLIVFIGSFYFKLKHSIDSLGPDDEGIWHLDLKTIMSVKDYLTFTLSQYNSLSLREIDKMMWEIQDIQKQRTRAQMHLRSLKLPDSERRDLEEMIADYDQRIDSLENRVASIHTNQIELEKYGQSLKLCRDSRIKWSDLKFVRNRVQKVNELVGNSDGSQSGDNRVEIQPSVG